MRKRVFSGIQPTGEIHLGNLLGAVQNWVPRQESYDALYCVVDLHAMTLPWEPRQLSDETLATAAALMACGIDPRRSILFVQSHVAAHVELAWVLTCVARMGELRRMVQFKERSRGETESVGVGLFAYPVLQAADVLLYKAHGVPVGEDQRQHVELMRDLGARFNSLFGDTFVLPEAWVPEEGARIMALDDPTQKMSKSVADVRPNSVILVADTPEAITKKISSAVTDSGREVRAGDDKPALTNLLTIFSLVEGSKVQDLEDRFAGAGYADFKRALADVLVERLRPIRERYRELMSDPAETSRWLAAGSETAARRAEVTMAEVRERIGLLSRHGDAKAEVATRTEDRVGHDASRA